MCSYLTQAAPYLRLYGWVHLFLINGHRDELVQDGCDTLPFSIVVVFAETHQITQPGSHVLQTQVF